MVLKALIVSNVTRKFQAGHYSMINPLEKLGYEVHWAANFSDFQGDYLKESPCTCHHINFNRNPFNLENIKAYNELNCLVQKENFDIIHCQSPIGGVLGRIVGHKNKVKKIVYTAHGLHFYKGAPIINRILYKSVEKYLGKYTDGFIVMNNEDFESIKKIKLKNDSNKKFKINGIGIDSSKFMEVIEPETVNDTKDELGITNDDIVVMSLGDLIKRKDYITSIRAIGKIVNELKDTDKNVKYFICGEGSEKDTLQELVEKLELTNNIFFLGYRNDVKQLLSLANVFLFSTLQEGLPRALMEAMGVGVPCVVTDIRGNNDLLQKDEGGFLFNKYDYDQAAKYILKIVNEPELKSRFQEFNKVVLKKFDISEVEKEMFVIYNNLIN